MSVKTKHAKSRAINPSHASILVVSKESTCAPTLTFSFKAAKATRKNNLLVVWQRFVQQNPMH